jgi:BON domain-containing protein
MGGERPIVTILSWIYCEQGIMGGTNRGRRRPQFYCKKIMNNKIAVLVSVVALSSFGAQAQTAGKATAGVASGQVNAGGQVPGGAVNAGAQGNTGAQINGAEQRDFPPLPPGAFAPANQTARRNGQSNTNQFSSGVFNQSSGVTNQLLPSSDGFSGNPNPSGLTPTSRDPRTQRVYATGNAAAANSAGATPPNQASTPFDRGMATRLNQRLQSQGVAPATSANVQFTTSGGQVTLVGSVPTVEDKARIVGIIQGSPGVVGVTDQLTVGGSGASATGTADQPTFNNAAPVPGPAPGSKP